MLCPGITLAICQGSRCILARNMDSLAGRFVRHGYREANRDGYTGCPWIGGTSEEEEAILREQVEGLV